MFLIEVWWTVHMVDECVILVPWNSKNAEKAKWKRNIQNLVGYSKDDGLLLVCSNKLADYIEKLEITGAPHKTNQHPSPL